MGKKRDHAIGLYMEGILEGNGRAALDKYTGAQYRQHSTGVPDGKEGFIAFFDDFLKRNPIRDIRVLRSIEDGPHVFLHVHQSLNNGAVQWVTTDFFDTDAEDKLIEHWDVIEAYASKTPSGHTTIDGPTEVRDLEHTEANKARVKHLLENLLIPGKDSASLGEYVAEDVVQHDVKLADGLPAYLAHVAGDTPILAYDEVVLLVGEGNFVATLCRARLDGVLTAQVDLYRLDRGRIVERWSSQEPVPPDEELSNSGKF